MCKDDERAIKAISDIIKESLEEVNDKYLLRRRLGSGVDTGYRFSDA